MCTAGQRVLLTITGPGPSFLKYENLGRAAIPESDIGYCLDIRISTNRMLDTGYQNRISESDIIRQIIKNPLDGNAKLKTA